MKTRILMISIFVIGLWATTASAEKLLPGTLFKDCKNCPEMIVIPAGSFTMGTDSRHKYEKPPHKVTLGKPYAIGRFEVTFDNWAACVKEKGCPRAPDDHKWGRGPRPVINLTWLEMQFYPRWLSKKTGHTYRMPSEAEWEYAARGGTTTEFWWGDKKGVNLANCRDCKSKWSKKGSAPVGSFKPNPFGLYDTSGNIWEWVLDCWVPNYQGAPVDGKPRILDKCRERVMRGGSWYYISKNMRPAWRFKNDYRVKSYGIGFRVLREIP